MFLLGDEGLIVAVYSAAPGSAAEDGLKLPATWSATVRNAPSADDAPSAEVDSAH